MTGLRDPFARHTHQSCTMNFSLLFNFFLIISSRMNVYVLIMQRSKNTESQSVETELQFSDVVKMENFDPDAAITSWWMTFIAPVSEDYTIH